MIHWVRVTYMVVVTSVINGSDDSPQHQIVNHTGSGLSSVNYLGRKKRIKFASDYIGIDAFENIVFGKCVRLYPNIHKSRLVLLLLFENRTTKPESSIEMSLPYIRLVVAWRCVFLDIKLLPWFLGYGNILIAEDSWLTKCSYLVWNAADSASQCSVK